MLIALLDAHTKLQNDLLSPQITGEDCAAFSIILSPRSKWPFNDPGIYRMFLNQHNKSLFHWSVGSSACMSNFSLRLNPRL
jgi:hypothetical protein